MTRIDPSSRDSFGTKFGVIAATAGSAIGLGNIWRFPYVAGENGGGAFLLIYLIFVIAIGIPVMMSEFVIGRSAQLNPVGAFKKLAPGKPWFLIGIMGVVAAFMILAFYAAVAGWTLEYIYQSVVNGFKGKSPQELGVMFDTFREGSVRPVIWFLVFMGMTAYIVSAGVKDGIEKYAKILMPILLFLLFILCIRAVTFKGAGAGLSFLFKPDFSIFANFRDATGTILEALGQAFFSLSIGMGTLITYGSYINKKDNLATTAVTVSLADTLIAVLAGVAIFPVVFAFGIDAAEGEDLVYKTLPIIFQQMTGGYIFSLMFFVLLGLAALTSTISVLEVVTAYFVEELGMVRKKATLIATLSISVLGFFTAASWGWFTNISLSGKNVFGILDFTSANILLPLGGLLIVAFIGWYFGRERVNTELSSEGNLKTRYVSVYMFIVKFIAPIAIALVFLNGFGIFKFS
ncbi:MAG: sodium-dependent transporter [Bacteroidales bacterium]|nr:MAG: sodium-dependent transporter [Bacteroidales bacterium]